MSRVEEVLRYRANVTIGFSIIMVILSLFLTTIYKNYSQGITKLMLVEEYSYLIPVIVSTINTLYLSLRQVGFSYSVRISKVILSLCFVSLSLIFYLTSYLVIELEMQLLGFSFSWLFLSLVILVYDPNRPVDLIPLASIFFLTPIPTFIIDSFTPPLSRVVGWVAAFTTGSMYVEGPGFSQIVVETHKGSVSLSVEVACTGIVTISTILSVFPILLYLTVASTGGTRKKVYASVASLLTSLLIGFAGNVLRVILVIIAVKLIDPETGLTLFHYSPSIVYASVSVATAVVIIRKILGAGVFQFKIPLHIEGVSPRVMIASLLLAMTISITYMGILKHVEAVSTYPNNEAEILVDSLNDLLNSPSKYLLNSSDVTFVKESYDDFLTRVLGALKVFRITFLVNKSVTYTGYIEIVDTPARLHTWQFCLTLQGFKIVDSWTRSIEGEFISFIRVWDGINHYLLSYVLRKVMISVEGENIPIYFRLSIFTPIPASNTDIVENEAVRLFSSLWFTSGGSSPTKFEMLHYATLAYYVTTISAIAYFLIMVTSLIINTWRKSRR
ncbi:MAG: archaeosortase/exosortase family protein [Thermosphaera sp.]